MAGGPQPVPDLGQRSDAPANDGGRGRAALRAIPRGLSGCARARGRGRAGRAKGMGGDGLLQPGPQPAPGRAQVGGDAWRCATGRSRGVGRYILAAVLSQAFDRRLPVVEANSTRVLCRLFAQAGDPKSAPVNGWLWETAASILPNKRVGDFNQALMELGALVCTPQKPDCSHCPLNRECLARREGIQDRIPHKSARPRIVEIREGCIVARHGGKVLLTRRPAGGRWANMWELPRVVLDGSESHDDAARRLTDSLRLPA